MSRHKPSTLKRALPALWRCAVVMLVALVWTGGPARAAAQDASLVGEVFVKDIPEAASAMPDSTRNWNIPVVQTRRAVDRVPFDQMCVALVAKSGDAKPEKPAALHIRGFAIEPGTAVVAPGASLTFTSHDRAGYTLVPNALSKLEPVSLAGDGATASVTLKNAGRYVFQDENAAQTRAWIVAVDKLVASAPLTPDSGADRLVFKLDALKPGAYALQLYYQGRLVQTRDVTVSATPSPKPIQLLITGDDLTQGPEQP